MISLGHIKLSPQLEVHNSLSYTNIRSGGQIYAPRKKMRYWALTGWRGRGLSMSKPVSQLFKCVHKMSNRCLRETRSTREVSWHILAVLLHQ